MLIEIRNRLIGIPWELNRPSLPVEREDEFPVGTRVISALVDHTGSVSVWLEVPVGEARLYPVKFYVIGSYWEWNKPANARYLGPVNLVTNPHWPGIIAHVYLAD
jgi:hypothetical protein